MQTKSDPAQRPLQSTEAHSEPPHDDPSTKRVVGLPDDLPDAALLLLGRNGTELLIADEDRVRSYTLSETECAIDARCRAEVRLPGAAAAIAGTSSGALLAIEKESSVILALVNDGEVRQLTLLPGKLTSMTASRREAFVATQRAGARGGALYRVELPSGTILHEQTLHDATVELQVDRDARWVSIIEKRTGTATLMTAEGGRHHRDCCCPQCPVEGRAPERTAGDDDSEPAKRNDTGRRPGLRDRWPGSAATPTPGGTLVVGQGGRVDHHDPHDDRIIPCTVDLLWHIDKLLFASGFLVASDARRRNLAVLSLKPLRVLSERRMDRRGAQFAVDPEAPRMLVRSAAKASWEVTKLDLLEKTGKEIVRAQPPIAKLKSKTFVGLHTLSLMGGHAPTKGPIKILLFPFIEKKQTFSDADVSRWAAYVNRTMVPVVKEYYAENSYDQLTQISLDTFGDAAGPKAGPLVLPRDYLFDYYFPQWTAAATILEKTGITPTSRVVFDGRETLKLKLIRGDLVSETLDIQFAALAFDTEHDLFPVQLRFAATDRLAVKVTTPKKVDVDLDLQFTAKTIDIDLANLDARLADLATYLDGIFKDAETRAGLTDRLFAKPLVKRVHVTGKSFGRLVVTVPGAVSTDSTLVIRDVSATVGTTDSIGLAKALNGTIETSKPADIATYLNLLFVLAEEAKSRGPTERRIDPLDVKLDAALGKLETTIPISTVFGGPKAAVTVDSSTGLASLFDTQKSRANSATWYDSSEALRDRGELYNDVFSAAVTRLLAAGMDPNTVFAGYHVVLIIPVEPAVTTPGDPDSVQAWESWNVTAALRSFDPRGAENMTTVTYSGNPKIQLQSVWSLNFFAAGKPDNPMICHELGHGLGFRDLYAQTGYRDELAYLGDWAMMCDHWKHPHHGGYHKWQAGWIPEARVLTIGPADPAKTTETELLLVPVELWDDSLIADSRTAFAMDVKTPVVQLVRLDLGGDGAVFDLIEAHQPGKKFGKLEGIIVTNALEPWDDQRYSFNGGYRREVQLLSTTPLLKTGDTFDLANAAELVAKGIVVTLVDAKTVGSAKVYRVKVTRKNEAYVDLYFSSADPYYKNPDLWVDWAGDNSSKDAKDHRKYPLGQPVDQGDAIRVPKSGEELHWIVARVRNRGGVDAEEVKLAFMVCMPPGAGDRGNFQLLDYKTVPSIPGGDVATDVPFAWSVPAGFMGHTCLLVQMVDFKIPRDSGGVPLASDDTWLANNRAQKNVSEFVPLSSSPYAPTEFDFSVNNDGESSEHAYLEPDGLPYGMTLTVTPPSADIPPKTTVTFHCKLELDHEVLEAGCKSDRQFRIVAWRSERESTTRWGGVQYQVRPRKRCAVELSGWWGYGTGTVIEVKGSVTPNPGGSVRLRLAFADRDATWVSTPLAADGTFSWSGAPPDKARALGCVALFEGNAVYGPATSSLLELTEPPRVR